MTYENIYGPKLEALQKKVLDNPIMKTILEPDDRFSEHRPSVIYYLGTGTKYIRGIGCHRDDNGKLKPNNCVVKFDKITAKVFEGARWDLVDSHDEYTHKKSEYETKKEKFERMSWYDLERRARENHNKIMAEWQKMNPPPITPFDLGEN